MSRISFAFLLGSFLLAGCQEPGNSVDSVSSRATAEAPTFAQALCAGCHAVKPLQLSPNPGAPAFADIVNRPGVTQRSLHRFLTDAHNYPEVMDFDLEPHHVEELSNYMITLKDPRFHKTPN